MKKTKNVIGPRAISDAVLSHGRQQTGSQLFASDLHSFNQANHQVQIIQQGRSLHLRGRQHNVANGQLHFLRQPNWRHFLRRPHWRRCLCQTRLARPPGIEVLLLSSSGRRLIISRGASAGLVLTVMLATAERTAEITSTGIARMRQKANATVNAMGDTPVQVRISGNDRVERVLVLTNKRINTLVQVPIFAKRKEIADGDDKKASDSVIISNLDTPSYYSIDAKASRRSTRFFYGLVAIHDRHLGTSPTVPISSQEILAPNLKRLLGKKKI